MTISIKKLQWFIHVIILVSLVVFSNSEWNEYTHIQNWVNLVSIFALSLFIAQIITLRLFRIPFADFRIWFLGFSYLFLFGQIFLNWLGIIDSMEANIVLRYPALLLYKSSLFALCYLQFIFFGMMIREFFYNKKLKYSSGNDENKENEIIIESNYIRNNVLITGWLMTLFSLPFRLFTDISFINQAQSLGSYKAIDVSSGIHDNLAVLFTPGIIFLLGSIKKKVVRDFILFAFISYNIGYMILSGDRRYPVISLLVILLFYISAYLKKFGIKQFIVGSVSIISLNLLAIIREIRIYSITGVYDFFSTYWSLLFSKNPIFETLSEFGITLVTVAFAIKNIPSYIPFQRGLSFYGAIPTVLPIGRFFPVFFQKVSIFRILTTLENVHAGASLPGELYSNFGWFGLVGALGFGILFSLIFDYKKNRTLYQFVNYYSLFYILINLVRSSFVEVFSAATTVYVFSFIIFRFISTASQNRAKKVKP